MFRAFAILSVLALSATTAEAQSTSERDYSKPPSKCICGTTPKDVIVFKGIVEDAQVLLNADHTNVLPRQATIFRVTDPGKHYVISPVKVWHVTNPDDCGLMFNYGKEYTIVARKVHGQLETNSCLTKIPPPSEPTLGH